MSYLVDSDWIIEALRGKPDALSLLATLRGDGVAISVLTLAEVSEGAYRAADRGRQLATLEQFLIGSA